MNFLSVLVQTQNKSIVLKGSSYPTMLENFFVLVTGATVDLLF